MSNKYDISSFGKRLKKLRTDKYKKDNIKYNFCKSQEGLAEKLDYERRTICKWENGKTHPNIEQVLDICNFLNCDIDYLLGTSDHPIKSAYEAADYTGIEYNNIISIINNKPLLNFLNYMLYSDDFNSIISGINNEFINKYISSDILSAYKAPLMNRIESAYAKFHANVSPFELSPKKVCDYLINEIPLSSFSKSGEGTFSNFLKENLSFDRINQISINNKFTSDTNEQIIYDAFISDTISCTFEIMEYMHTRDLKMYQLAHSFLNVVNMYITKQCDEQRNKLQKTFKDI